MIASFSTTSLIPTGGDAISVAGQESTARDDGDTAKVVDDHDDAMFDPSSDMSIQMIAMSISGSRDDHDNTILGGSAASGGTIDLGGAYAPLPREDSPWLRELEEGSLPEVHGTVNVPTGGVKWWRTCLAYLGPGVLVAVGYMDPGNWSTDIAGGSSFGYTLLFVILLSTTLSMFLQGLAAKLGLATGRDLAQCCRDSYPPYVVAVLWFIMEIAIGATDLAEVIGSAVALKLLFGLPLIAGVCITACDVLIVLAMNGRSFRLLEGLVAALILLITGCFAAQIALSQPNARDVMIGFLPTQALFKPDVLFLAIGIIGATVMPHNLFLHSSIVLTRNTNRDDKSIADAIKYSIADSTVSLFGALFVNAAILIVSAATFHQNGYTDTATLEDAYVLLNPILGSAAAVIFAVALLASGQNSTLTGTLSGQIVMEGFMTWRVSPTLRRLVTRLLAIVPAVIATAVGGDGASNDLLILSQVVLSYALPFAVFPLVQMTSSKSRMGKHVNSLPVTIIAYTVFVLIVVLNITLVVFS
jgi:manganese transport protein